MTRKNGYKIAWVTPKRGAQGHDPDVVIRVSAGERNGKNPTPQHTVTLYEPFMREFRILAGDRIQIGFMDDGRLAMRRTQGDGYRLTPQHVRSKEERATKYGTLITSNFKFSMHAPITGGVFKRSDIEVTPDGEFIVPARVSK
jgi:hypothetical protein